MKKFVNFYDKISRIHQELITEIVNCFKENNVNKIDISYNECPLILSMYDEWGEGTINETITDIEIELEGLMTTIKMYTKEHGFFDQSDCADGNALLYVYEYVWSHFYGNKE